MIDNGPCWLTETTGISGVRGIPPPQYFSPRNPSSSSHPACYPRFIPRKLFIWGSSEGHLLQGMGLRLTMDKELFQRCIQQLFQSYFGPYWYFNSYQNHYQNYINHDQNDFDSQNHYQLYWILISHMEWLINYEDLIIKCQSVPTDALRTTGPLSTR